MEVLNIVLIVLGSIIGAIIAFEVFVFLVLIFSSIFINTKKEHNKNSKYYRFILNFTTGLTLFMDRIHVHVTGLEKVPTDSRFLLVCNHRSKFDPITTWYALRKYDVAFITKPENLKIPFYGKLVQKCCFMPIDRENPKLAIPTIIRSAKLLQDNEVSIGVYPEGTRSKTLELLPFHAAVFKIATKAKVPIVVMTVYGTENVKKAFPFGRSDVYLDFVEVISADEVQNSKSVDLCNKAEAIIRAHLEKYEN